MKTEIEVKAKVLDKDRILKKLTSLGCVFSGPVTQDDTVFTEKAGSLEEFLENDVFLRIRIQDNGKVILTAKKPVKKSAETLVKIEHETEVSSADEARAILELAGFSQALRIRKERRTAHYEEYEICLDEVEGLGPFIELEQMADSAEAEGVQREMFAFLMSLGIAPEAQVKKGYDILLIEKSSEK